MSLASLRAIYEDEVRPLRTPGGRHDPAVIGLPLRYLQYDGTIRRTNSYNERLKSRTYRKISAGRFAKAPDWIDVIWLSFRKLQGEGRQRIHHTQK